MTVLLSCREGLLDDHFNLWIRPQGYKNGTLTHWNLTTERTRLPSGYSNMCGLSAQLWALARVNQLMLPWEFHGFPWLRTSYYATLLLYTSRSDSRIQQTTITSLVFATPQARPSPYDSLVDNPSVGSCELSLNCSEFWKRSSWVMVLVQSHNVVFVFWVFFFGGVGIINQFWIRNWNFNLIDHWKRYGLATV